MLCVMKWFSFCSRYDIISSNGGDGVKRLAWLMLVMLLCRTACAEGFDQTMLEQREGYSIFRDANQVDTVVRPLSQPYGGEVDLTDGLLEVFLDFVQVADEDMTFLRLTLSLTSCDYVAAREMTITVGGRDYVFQVQPQCAEYDLTYYEDFSVCLTDESLPMVKAMARSKQDTFPIRLVGNVTVEGSITLPLDEVADIYDTYVDLGGLSQRLDNCREEWPVAIVDSKK